MVSEFCCHPVYVDDAGFYASCFAFHEQAGLRSKRPSGWLTGSVVHYRESFLYAGITALFVGCWALDVRMLINDDCELPQYNLLRALKGFD